LSSLTKVKVEQPKFVSSKSNIVKTPNKAPETGKARS